MCFPAAEAGLGAGEMREMRKLTWNVNVTQHPSGTGCFYGPRSQARPRKSTQRQIGRCALSKIVLGQQELGVYLPDSASTQPVSTQCC